MKPMTPQEKQEWWARTLTALEARDPRVHLAMLTAMILRHGRFEECASGKHTHIIERITLEELFNVINGYHFSVRMPEYGLIEIQALPKEDVNGRPPDIDQSGPSPERWGG